MGFHHLKFFFGQRTGFVEDFRRDGPLADVVEQGQGRIHPYLRYSQRRNDCGGGKNAEQAAGQVLKLYAVGRVVNEKLLPAEDFKCRFYVQFYITCHFPVIIAINIHI